MDNKDQQSVRQSSSPEQKRQTIPSSPRLSSKNIFILGATILTVVVIGVGIYVLSLKRNESSNQHIVQLNAVSQANPTSYSKANWKTYTNDFYHFKVDIPPDWNTEESISNYGEHNFKLTSKDKTIIITNENKPSSYRSSTQDKSIPSSVAVGTYNASRFRYITDNNQSIDWVTYSAPARQKGFSFYLDINGDFASNNKTILEILKTFAYTKTEPLLEELFSYTLPEGWVKDDDLLGYTPIEAISFHSADITYPDGSPYFLTGAKIIVNRYFKNPNSSLKEDIDMILLNFENKTYDYPSFKIADTNALNAFICYEGCSDSYFLIKNGYVWRIGFTCAPNCSTKAGVNSNEHARERDLFIRSIKFN